MVLASAPARSPTKQCRIQYDALDDIGPAGVVALLWPELRSFSDNAEVPIRPLDQARFSNTIATTIQPVMLPLQTILPAIKRGKRIQALFVNTSGDNNTASGYEALYSNVFGYKNTATSTNSLRSNAGGIRNTASGYAVPLFQSHLAIRYSHGASSLFSNTDGKYNTAIGMERVTAIPPVTATASRRCFLARNRTGNYNTASGFISLVSNTTGNYNTASGYASLYSNTTGTDNTASGLFATNNTIGNYNTASGYFSLITPPAATTRRRATRRCPTTRPAAATWPSATVRCILNTTGNYNMGIGEIAGFSNSTGSNNVFHRLGRRLFETGSDKLISSPTMPGTPLMYGEFSATAANNKLGIGTDLGAGGRHNHRVERCAPDGGRGVDERLVA